MARCKDCIHYAVCAKEGRLVQVDEHTWDDYNQLDDVERFCDNYIATADVAPRADVIEEYRQRVNTKMGKHTHLLGKEYVQRILREVAKEMKNEQG